MLRPRGHQLNLPARITLENVKPSASNPDPERYRRKIAKRTQNFDAKLIDYDAERGGPADAHESEMRHRPIATFARKYTQAQCTPSLLGAYAG